MSSKPISKEQVINRLRETFRNAAKDGTGVSFMLSQEECRVVTEHDIETLKDETGYSAMLAHQPNHR
ncbi:hypothetical protein [Ralstonia sp. ASV6]|uniref:hypothetical protein n=1 Tax=Ralstonia sp. ASV6 TaxID=2795124 RepID=UPI0018EA4E3B|nr:hypothetical protein [Ralstonia sp. ASV6]